MNTDIIFDKSSRSFRLVGKSQTEKGKLDVLASLNAADADESIDCWYLIDPRLSKFKYPSPYSLDANSDDWRATYIPKDHEQLVFIRSLLNEYIEEDGIIYWCTFDNIARGGETVNGFPSAAGQGKLIRPIYMTRSDGLDKLKEIKSFWDGYEGDIRLPKIENPYRQPSAHEVYLRVSLKNVALDNVATPAMGAAEKNKALVVSEPGSQAHDVSGSEPNNQLEKMLLSANKLFEQIDLTKKFGKRGSGLLTTRAIGDADRLLTSWWLTLYEFNERHRDTNAVVVESGSLDHDGSEKAEMLQSIVKLFEQIDAAKKHGQRGGLLLTRAIGDIDRVLTSWCMTLHEFNQENTEKPAELPDAA